MTKNLDRAWSRVEKKRSHKLRNTIFVTVGVGGAVAVALKSRSNGSLPSVPFTGGSSPRTIDESIEVNVPVSVSYNQWTQFEDFPLFMEGVEHVQQLDDTRLHWVADVAGKKAEWDAKILEQHPDRQISWISEDGKKTRGTVTFEPISEDKTRIRISMSYQADPIETVGSAAGLDSRRVQGRPRAVQGTGREPAAPRAAPGAAKSQQARPRVRGTEPQGRAERIRAALFCGPNACHSGRGGSCSVWVCAIRHAVGSDPTG